MDTGEGEKAVFHCKARGIPEPNHFWFINGTPIASKFSCLNLHVHILLVTQYVQLYACNYKFYVSLCKLYFISITEVQADSERIVEKHRLIWYNVTKKDATVIQCNATNENGYIYRNAYLNVLSK